MKKLIAILLWASALVAIRAQDEMPDAKAATEIIQSLQGTLGDLSTILNLPPQQRVDWILNQAAERVQERMIEKAKDQLKEAMDNYAKAAFRANAFKTIAIPALKNAAILNTAVNWELLETQMASKVDTRTSTYGAAAAGATIVWDSIDAFSEQGAQAGFSKLAAGIYEAVADAYIPGWGWFKLGTTLVEGLGNFVLSYATDTATEGMLNDLFNMKGDPKAFAQMLQTTPLADIYKRVDDSWELVAFGRLWNGQGTDAGDAAMKQRLKDSLYALRTGVAHEYALQQQKDAELQAKFQPYLDAAAQAEAKLRAAAAKVQADASSLLAATRDFQRRSSQLAVAKYTQEAQTYHQQAESAPGEPEPYTPIPRDGYMPFYMEAYGRVKETTGGSFDAIAFDKEIWDGHNARAQAVNSQVEPPDGAGKIEWLDHRRADHQAILSELAKIQCEADQRAALMAQEISEQTSQMAKEINEQSEKLEQGLIALENEAAENLRLPETYHRCGYAQFTDAWLCGNPFYAKCMNYWISPADEYQLIMPYLQKLESDRDTLDSLNARRRKLYADFSAILANTEDTMQAIIPEGCKVFTDTVAGSDRLRRTWGINYTYGTPIQLVFQNMPLSAIYVLPELQQGGFNSPQAISAVKARLGELQSDYDRWELQVALGRVTKMLDDKFKPFAVAKPSSHAASLMARVNGILDYRKPWEETDLYRFVQRFEPVCLAAQSRIEFLQRYPALVDAGPYLKMGTNLNLYKTLLTGDREGREQARAQAEILKAGLQQALGHWSPILKQMNPEYYEEALGGLGATFAEAQVGYLRARAANNPTYVMMEEFCANFIPQVLAQIQEAQTEYNRIISWYGQTMPAITPNTSTLTASAGQPLSVTFNTSEPGGAYSAKFLPPGLSIDPVTGTLSGKASQGETFAIVVRYTSLAGVSTCATVRMNIAPAKGGISGLTIRNGYPELRLNGVPGLNYILQVVNGLGGDNRWTTIQTLTMANDQEWTDVQETQIDQRFYRTVWLPTSP